MISAVFGGSGIVGGFIVQHLPGAVAVSRKPGNQWITADLTDPRSIRLPDPETIYCTANAGLFANALPSMLGPSLRRVVVFTTTSILTKETSPDAGERQIIAEAKAAEQKIQQTCEAAGIEWTILRPCLIYCEGRDRNITRLSRQIERFGFFPLCGPAQGLRQPVHAEDLARGAIAAASSKAAANRVYALPGGEILTFREMIGRVFDGMNRKRRLISLPPSVWKGAFMFAQPMLPGFNPAMGDRMSQDMVFDSGPAIADFGWQARPFSPRFKIVS